MLMVNWILQGIKREFKKIEKDLIIVGDGDVYLHHPDKQ